MIGAKLDRASLKGANLLAAFLDGASLENAEMEGANLRFASLWGANFSGAKLEGASMYGAHVWRNNGYFEPATIDLFSLDFRPGKVDQYLFLLNMSLDGVPKVFHGELTGAIRNLKPSESDSDAYLTYVDWYEEYNRYQNTRDFARAIINVLGGIVCQARAEPFVAEGVVIYRMPYVIVETGHHSLRLIDKLLSGGPGTINLDDGAIVWLKVQREKLASNSAGLHSGKKQ